MYWSFFYDLMIMKLISEENLILNEGFVLICLEDDILEWEGEVMC